MSETTKSPLIVSLPPLPEGFSYGDLTLDEEIEIFDSNNHLALVYLDNILNINPETDPLLFLGTILGATISFID